MEDGDNRKGKSVKMWLQEACSRAEVQRMEMSRWIREVFRKLWEPHGLTEGSVKGNAQVSGLGELVA